MTTSTTDRVALLTSALVWAAPASMLPGAAAFLAVFSLPPGWWTLVGVVVLWSFQAVAVACALVLHWVPRLRARLALTGEREVLRSVGLIGLAGFSLALGLAWLVRQVETGGDAPAWTVLLACASLPLTLLAAVDRQVLRRRSTAAPPPSAVERRAFRPASRHLAAPRPPVGAPRADRRGAGSGGRRP